MKIRNGNYTRIHGNQLKIYEVRHETPQSNDQLRVLICFEYEPSNSGFQKNKFEELWCKPIFMAELSNAFKVESFALYRGIKVRVSEIKKRRDLVHIYNDDYDLVREFEFLNLGNTFGKDVSINELEKIWEVRGQSAYDLPVPQELPLYFEVFP